MVTGYTANAYGDFFIASLNTPYTNTVKIIEQEAASNTLKIVWTIKPEIAIV